MVVGLLQLDRWDVAAILEQAGGVEPVDPFGGGVFDLVDAAPRALVPDDLGLVEAVDGLGQRVVIARPDRADRGGDPGDRDPFAVADRLVLLRFKESMQHQLVEPRVTDRRPRLVFLGLLLRVTAIAARSLTE